MRIGFIGIGQMGAGMAARLLQAGHDVVVYNRSRAKAEPLAAKGAIIADSVAQACTGAAVFTMLSNDAAVDSVVSGEGGILASLAKGAIHVSSSTISVALSDRLAKAHREAGQRYVVATVLGRPEMAEAGKLFVIAAGEPAAVDEVAPLLDAVGQKTSVFGEQASAANMVKLATNFLTASVIEALGEAVAVTQKAGIDRRQFVDFLRSTNFDAPVFRIFGELIIADSPPAVGFAAPLAFKDIRLALEAADDLRVPMHLASLLHDRFVELLANGGEHMDWSALGRTFAGTADASAGRPKRPAMEEARP